MPGSNSGSKAIPAWLLPVIIAGIAVSIVGGFYLGGPGLGMAVGALDAATVVVLAVREPPLGPIAPAAPHDSRRHVLVVLERPLGDDVAASESVARAIRLEGLRPDEPGTAPDVRLLVPCRTRFLDRWASDLDRSRHRAQRDLVLSAAALAAAGVEASARAGDEDVVQMVEDELRTFPATEVLYVGAADGATARALDERLLVPFRRLAAGQGGGALEQERVDEGLRQISP
ncbi:MAG TPA: hypothetical protein VEB65_07465 [Solirubrobacterales bacterium]|nr:hypothetical protein [Solirubrobacterales bacterium]